MISQRSSVLLLIAAQLVAIVSASPSYPQALAHSSPVSSAPASKSSTPALAYTSGRKRASTGYNNPKDNGGSMLTIVNGTYPAGLGEPLNVILSADSDAAILADTADGGGFINYMLGAELAEECLGQHLGSDQQANLGDGEGNVTQIQELRYDYGDPYIGSCKETFSGGLHLRYWIQNNTKAYFMAVSVEMSLTEGHDIVVNGYDIGRDYLVGNLTGITVPTANVTNTTTYSGSVTYANYTYQTDVAYVSGLLNDSSDGINHYITVEENGQPAIDGLVAVLTVKITAQPQSSSAISFISQIPLVTIFAPLVLSSLFTLL